MSYQHPTGPDRSRPVYTKAEAAQVWRKRLGLPEPVDPTEAGLAEFDRRIGWTGAVMPEGGKYAGLVKGLKGAVAVKEGAGDGQGK